MRLGSSFRRRSICILIGLAALAACPAAVQADPFQQVMTMGATAWGDYNNDGWSDAFGGGTVWTNNQDGTFSQTSPFGGLATISLGDYNNDGLLDVYSYVSHAGSRLYANDGAGGWINDTAKFSSMPVNLSVANTFGDFNGDGYLDTYVTGLTWPWVEPFQREADVVFTSNAGESFTQTWSAPARFAKGVTTVDFDRDADLDVYVSNYWLDANFLLRNNGTGGFTDVASSYGAVDGPGHTQGSAVGDFNNDGEFDIYVSNFAHPGNPELRFLENQGAAGSYHFTNKGLCGITQLEPFAGATTGDFDNDGYLDLFITTSGGYSDSGKTRLYHNNGNWTFSEVDYGLANAGQGDRAAWADYDNDGYLDIVAAGNLWRNPGTANWNNHWLKVKLQGGQGDNGPVNGSAIGAQVRIDVPGLGTISRQIAGNTGIGMQNDLTMHFGLGTYDGPVDLEIFWPDGSTQVVTGVAVDQLTTVSLTPYTEPLSMELVPVSDPNTPQGYTIYDLMATVDTDLAAFEMILSADTPGSIYQHAGGNGYYEPDPFIIGLGYPELEFDTYVTMGAWPYPSPTNAIGGAVDILEGSVLTFDEQNLNITWATSGGSYQSGPGTFQVARITLANHATADYTVMGWQADFDPVTIQGTIAANPDQLTMHMEEAADQTGVPAGYTTYDFYAVTDTNLAAFEMILEASKEGGIYQHAGGNGYYEPDPFIIGLGYPELEFDTYVTMGAWPYPSPTNAIGGAVDIHEGSVLTFDDTTLNITWAISGGSYLSGPGTFLIARVTLANDSAASWILRGQQTDFGAVLLSGDMYIQGDADHDGFVGADDLVAVLTYWGQTDPPMGDLSGDGFVGADDYVEVLTYWGNSSTAPEPAPEPASLGLLLVGGFAILKRSR